MKFWQKVYFSTLLVFLMVFNICILTIIGNVYHKNLDLEKQKAENDLFWLERNIQKELTYLKQRDRLLDRTIISVAASYAGQLAGQEVSLELWRDGSMLYSGTEFDIIGEKMSKTQYGKHELLYRFEDMNYYALSTNLEEDFTGYKLIYVHKLTALERFLERMEMLCMAVGLSAAVFLAAVLYVLLKRLTRPLSVLSEASQVIAEGDYSRKIMLRGNDEFSELGSRFNHMADEIQKRMQSLREEGEKKQQLIDNMAHEIRTPLTSIHGYAEYMLRASVSEKEKYEVLQFMKRESARLSNLGKGLLLLADIRNSEVVYQRIELVSLCSSIRLMLQDKLSEKNIEFTVIRKIPYLYGDYALFQSLIQNLAENAVRACETGGQVVLSFYEDGGNRMIRIRDNGKGMAESELSHITEPFYRTDKARSRAEGGAGIGLALCRQIVEAYHGTMEFASQKGKGTTVTVIFTTSLQVD